jgi:hypothetical protein
MYRIFFLLIACGLGLIGCTSQVEIEQADYTRKIVVDGWMEAGDYAHVYLTLSAPYLTQYDSASIRASMLNYAKITLKNSQNVSEVLTLVNDNSTFPPFVYRSVSMVGEVGESYQLTIETMGHTLTAATTIPDIPTVENVWIENKTDSSGILKVSVLPDKQNTLHLLLQTKSAKADEDFHPSLPRLATILAGTSTTVLDLYRTAETNIVSTSYKNEFYYRWPKYQFSLQDTVMVKIGTVDQESYTVLKSIFLDENDSLNPFAFNGNTIQTNITGGIGHWTGVGVASIKVVKP